MSLLKIVPFIFKDAILYPYNDPDADQYLSVVGDLSTSLYSNEVAQYAIRYAITQLKNTGIWYRTVALHIYVGADENKFAVNVKDPRNLNEAHRLVFEGGGFTFADTGCIPNGTSSYARTFLELANDVPPYSFHAAFFNATGDPFSGSDEFVFGGGGNGPTVAMDLYNGDRVFLQTGQVDFNNANVTLTLNSGNLPDVRGLYTMNLYHDTGYELWKDGELKQTQPTSRWGYFPPLDPNNNNGLITLFANNDNETINFFAKRECRYSSFGYALTDLQNKQLAEIVKNFNKLLNRSI